MISLKLASREIKNNLKYWFLFTLNLSIGLIGFTFIYLFRENITSTMEMKAKSLLTSDIAITGRRDLGEDELSSVRQFFSDKKSGYTDLIELYSMGASNDKSRLVLIKTIKGKYPLVGEIKFNKNQILTEDISSKMQEENLVIVAPELAYQLKIGLGDELKLGKQKFKIFGIINSDSTSSMRGVNLAPKIYIGRNFLESTGLVSQGTVAWYSRFYNLKKDLVAEELKPELYKLITDPAIKIKTPKNSSDQLSRVVNYLSDYLGLIGVVAILISTVGANYLFQSYVFDRLKQIGILKSLGVSQKNILFSFLLIISFFGLLGTSLALFISNTTLPFAIEYLKDWIIGDFSSSITLNIFITMVSIGIIINILVCMPILVRVFGNKTNHLLNGELVKKNNLRDILLYLPAVLFIWLISVWQAHSFVVGSVFSLAMFLVFLFVLTILPFFLKAISHFLIGKLVSYPIGLSLGYGSRVLSRNSLSSVLTILCLSIGVTLLSVVGQIDKSLKSELTDSKTPKPSLFLFDIQEEQYKPLKKLSENKNFPLIEPTPMIRARLVKKNGKKIERKEKQDGFTTREEETQRRFNNRGVNLSFAKELNIAEEIVEGKPFSGEYSGEGVAEISLEQRYAKRLKIEIGDTLTYDILGVEIQGKIVNLRKVRWTSFIPNFFIVFQPGAIDDAPKSYLAAVEKINFDQQLKVQDDIISNFANISILNVTEVISKILSLFDAMAWAISVMSLCCISVGLFVLYSILQSQMFKKQRELALQKLMGMNETSILMTLISEYMFLVIISLVFGNCFGLLIGYGVSYLFLDGIFSINWSFFIYFNTGLLLASLFLIFISFRLNFNKNIKHLLS